MPSERIGETLLAELDTTRRERDAAEARAYQRGLEAAARAIAAKRAGVRQEHGSYDGDRVDDGLCLALEAIDSLTLATAPTPDSDDLQGAVDQFVEEQLAELAPESNGIVKLFRHSDGRAIELEMRRAGRPSLTERWAQVTEENRQLTQDRGEARGALADLVDALFLDDVPRLRAIEKARELLERWGMWRRG